MVYDFGFCCYFFFFWFSFVYLFYTMAFQEGCRFAGFYFTIIILYHFLIILGFFFWYCILGSESCLGGDSFSMMLVGREMVYEIREKRNPVNQFKGAAGGIGAMLPFALGGPAARA